MRIRATFALALGFVFSLASAGPAQAATAPTVAASIKPIHALVAGVMEGVGTPVLLITGLRSEHDFALKPSDAKSIEQARLVFWMGPSMEAFLARPSESLGAGVSVPLGERLGALIRSLRLDLMRETHEDEAHGDDAEHADEHEAEHHEGEHDEHHGAGHAHVGPDGKPLPDLHAWLDPTIAAAMVEVIAAELGRADPDNAARYVANAGALKERLAALDRELSEALAPVRERPFIVFHDAYQYFELRYRLNGIGSLSIEPHEPPGARHLSALRERIEEGHAACVFAEPQFEPKLVRSLVDGTPARSGTLDPIGADQPAGVEAYFGLMRALAASLRSCLAG